MRIHREGRTFLLVLLVALLLIHLVINKYYTTNNLKYAFFTAISILFYAFFAYFFRDPQRATMAHPNDVLSPADGKVVVIQEVEVDEYLHDRRIQVSIYMSPFNVHVNRSPIAGIVKYFKYHPGKYLVAWHPKSSTKNERTTVVVEHKEGFQVLLRQIAGAVARRIRFYCREGDHLEQGSEFGFIKFGSRVDVFLPLDTEIKVSLGEKVKGGVSVLAKL